MILARRSFLTGLGASLITAPAIVRAGTLMPVKVITDPGHQHMVNGVSLFANQHPVSTAWSEGFDLNKRALLELILEIKDPRAGLDLRPRFLHIP